MTIYFPSGARIGATARGDVRRVAALFREYQATAIELHGFSDPGGDAQANLALSRQRVAAVRAALIDFGLPPDRIRGEGHGEVDPGADSLNLSSGQRLRVEVFLR
jgi:outer membrane protein OmpA-like peptidoglycan-associated protein